ncbi:MAG: hypothetical protein ACRBN8_34220 [Nannocystales bacterium]
MTNATEIRDGMRRPRRFTDRLLVTVALASLVAACGDDVSESSEGTTGTGSTGSSSGSDSATGSSGLGSTADSGNEGSGTQSPSSTDTDGSSGSGESFEPPQETWRTALSGARVHSICVHTNDDILVVSSDADPLTDGAGFVERVSSDGVSLWDTQYGETEPVYFYEVVCGTDGSVYAVGHVGEEFFVPDPLLVRFDPETGEELWSQRVGISSGGGFMGASADEQGVYVAGWAGAAGTLAHYSSDGVQDWGVSASDEFVREVHAIRRWGDQLFATGFARANTDSIGWVAAFGLDGELHWSAMTGEGDTWASFLLPSPDGESMLVAGQSDVSFEEETWVLTCDAEGCDSNPQPLEGPRKLEGFAMDSRGHWLGTDGGLIRAQVPGGENAWSYSTQTRSPYPPQDSVLATDSQGAILLGGVDESSGAPVLVKLALPGD